MKKSLVILIAVIVLVAAGFYFYQDNKAQAPSVDPSNENQNQEVQNSSQNQNNQTQSQATSSVESFPQGQATTTPDTNSSGGTFSSGEEPDGPDIQVVSVSYDGRQFTPNILNIKVNDYVVFKNNSDSDFWPASDPHPSHTNNPAFDPKQPIPAGGKFQYQFTKEGVWGFHDHNNPLATGKITVTK